MKNGSKRVSKFETREVNNDIMDALREEPNSDAISNKTKKVKIVGLSKPPSGSTPKIKFSNIEAGSASTAPKAILSLKRKLEADGVSTDRPPPPSTIPITVPAIPMQVEQNAPAFNSKRLTEKGLTVDRTPFRRVRALKLLHYLREKYRVLVSVGRLRDPARLLIGGWSHKVWTTPRRKACSSVSQSDSTTMPELILYAGRYYTEIKKPMYFDLMEQKIEKDQYQTIGEFAADLEQILWKWVSDF